MDAVDGELLLASIQVVLDLLCKRVCPRLGLAVLYVIVAFEVRSGCSVIGVFELLGMGRVSLGNKRIGQAEVEMMQVETACIVRIIRGRVVGIVRIVEETVDVIPLVIELYDVPNVSITV